jgi:hypothetical protein
MGNHGDLIQPETPSWIEQLEQLAKRCGLTEEDWQKILADSLDPTPTPFEERLAKETEQWAGNPMME